MKTKIEILINESYEPFGSIAGTFVIEESNIKNIAKNLNIEYLGGDGRLNECYLFEVDDSILSDIIEKLKTIEFITYVGLYDESLRIFYDSREEIDGILEKIENYYESTNINKKLDENLFVSLEKCIMDIKNLKPNGKTN